MAGPNTTASDQCACGHVGDHHRGLGLLNPSGERYCEWRGCGCPRFIAGSVPVPLRTPQQEHHAAALILKHALESNRIDGGQWRYLMDRFDASLAAATRRSAVVTPTA